MDHAWKVKYTFNLVRGPRAGGKGVIHDLRCISELIKHYWLNHLKPYHILLLAEKKLMMARHFSSHGRCDLSSEMINCWSSQEKLKMYPIILSCLLVGKLLPSIWTHAFNGERISL